MAAIEVRGVRKVLGGQEVLRGVDLTVGEGEVFGVIGPDGSGKSTLIRILAGILLPTGGEAFVAGIDVMRGYEEVRRKIGYMPQVFALWAPLTVEENLRAVARIHGINKIEFKKRTERLYRFSGLGPFRNRRADQLSGGMRQKLGLSCVLIHEPPVLLLDEPTVGVDPISRREFWDILHALAAEGTTILISTPYLEEAERCHRTAFVHQGRILEVLDPRELKERFPYTTCDIYAPNIRGLLVKLQKYSSRAFISGDHIHLICEKEAFASGKVEGYVRRICPKGAQIKIVTPTVGDFYFALEQKEDVV